MVNTNPEPPTLYEVSQMGTDYGLVGEDDTHLSVFLITINGGFVIMSAPSRSGKDQVVDAVEYCRSGNDIARIPNSTSKTVLYQRAAELNDALIHRYPDITDLDEHIETLLKEHGDGRDSKHQFTDVSGEDRQVVEQVIEPPNSMVLFAASDNQNIDLNDYPEVRNRAIILSTDASAELTRKIKERQAEMEVGMYERNISEERTEEVRNYVSQIPIRDYTTREAEGEVWNITHYGFGKENPLPDLFPESRMDFRRFNKFVKAVTMFHHEDRLESPFTERDAMFSMLSTPEDLWQAWRIFGEKMVLSALNLRDMDFEILGLLRDSGTAMTAAEVQMEMRKRGGQNYSDNQVRRALDGMLDKGYVIKDQGGNRVKYQPSPFATADQVSTDIEVDFENIVEGTKEAARSALPEELADEYISKYCEGEGLLTTHPFTGETINIIEQSMTEDIEEQQEQEEQVIENTDPFASSDDDGDGGNADLGSIGSDDEEDNPLEGAL